MIQSIKSDIKKDPGLAVITAIVLLVAVFMGLCILFRHHNVGV